MNLPPRTSRRLALCFYLSLVVTLAYCSVAFAQNAPVSGKWQRQSWNGIAGSNVANLTESPFFYQAPSSTALVDSSYSLLGDNYGARTRGYITPTTTGIYTFWVAGNHETQWFVSSNTSKWDARKLSGSLSVTQENNWDQSYAQRSAPQFMKAGQSYYVELLQKAGTGGGHASVAWAMQGVDSSVVQNWATPSNGAVATQSSSLSNSYAASNLVDGNTETFNHTGNTAGSSVQVDFGKDRLVERVEMINRGSFQNRLSNFRVTVEDVNGAVVAAQDFYPTEGAVGLTETWTLVHAVVGRRVKIQLLGPNRDNNYYLHLAELRAFGSDTNVKNWSYESSVVATQSSIFSSSYPASNLIDGKIQTFNHTANTAGSSVQVDLGQDRLVDSVELINRDSSQNRLSNFRVSILDSADAVLASQDYYLTSGNVQGALRWQLPEAVIGRKVKVQLLGLNRNNNYYLHLAELNVWGRTSSNESERGLRTLVSPDVMSSYEPTLTDDADDSGYEDTWQNAYGFPAGYQTGDRSALADPDGDLRNNLREALLNTNPFVGNGERGWLTRFSYNNIPYYSLGETRKKHRYFGAPDLTAYHDSSLITGLPKYSAGRIRGAVTPSETGYYRFWISTTESAELWLSREPESRFHKELLCAMSTELGSGHGVKFDSVAKWDSYVFQMSHEVYLEAGKAYYLEADYQFGHAGGSHVSIAWAKRGGPRTAIPAEALSAYFTSPDDLDDDMLPDSFEQAYGLSIADAGNLDIERQGEFGDYDQDGLTNHEEFMHGTDPSNPDTDGDGVQDRQEIRLGTNPTLSNDFQVSEISSLNLQAYDMANTTGVWQAFEGGILGDSFRGDIAYHFSVPENGFYHLEILGKLRGILQRLENFPMRVSIDGKTLQPFSMRFVQSQLSSESIVTPWLQAGDHHLVIHLDNEIGRRKFQLLGLRILTMGGFDANNNNLPDWMDNQFAESNGMSLVASSSFVSPLFVEGKTRYKGGVELTSGSTVITTQNGLGDNHWFANVLLSPTVATPLQAQFENGMVQNSASVEWIAWNTMQNTSIAIRAGDSLKLQAAALGSSTAAITVQGQSYSVADGDYLVKTFPAGVHTIKTVRAGQTVNATVTAYTANFGETLPFYSDFVTWRTYPNVPAALWVDAEPDLLIAARQAYGTGQKIQFSPKRAGTLTFGARLYPGGPLVTLSTTTTVGVADALETDATSFVGNTEDGYNILRTPIVITNLPPRGRVVLTIFRAGVTFLDGTTVKTLYASDLVNGVAHVDFRYPPGMTGGYCHYIRVYDAANNLLGTR